MFNKHNLNTYFKLKMWVIRKKRVLLKRWFSNLEYSKFIQNFKWESLWFRLENQSKCLGPTNYLKLIKLEKFENRRNLRNFGKYLDILKCFNLEKKSNWKSKI